MADSLARISPSSDNIIELDRVRPGRPGRASVDHNLCPDLCTDFPNGRVCRKVKKSRKKELTPALIDDLRVGKLDDSKTGALSIEVLPSGKKRWLYRRRIAGRGEIVKLSLGLFPAYSIADAREWANRLNLQIDAGVDPRETARQEFRLATMTVDRAHELYMEAVREGRSSRAKRPNKPRTVADKQDIYRRDIAPKLGRKIIYDVTEADLIKLVEAKGKQARVRANRLAAELKVFFGWTASLRGLEVGLEVDPARRLGDLRFPETPRTRRLALQEIAWFLEALVGEERDYQRGMLLWLLTAARLAEVAEARSDELCGGVWTIPACRTKNSVEHRIALGPWGWSLMQSDSEWVFPAPKLNGSRSRSCWYVARNRVRERMAQAAGRPIERFTPHDFRRTCRSNTKRLKVDFETALAPWSARLRIGPGGGRGACAGSADNVGTVHENGSRAGHCLWPKIARPFSGRTRMMPGGLYPRPAPAFFGLAA